MSLYKNNPILNSNAVNSTRKNNNNQLLVNWVVIREEKALVTGSPSGSN